MRRVESIASYLAADLVRLKVDIIVAATTPESLAAKHATRAIPIVMASVGDPVAAGLAESLARPGGNITGLSQMGPGLVGKRLALLTEMVPKLSRVAVLWDPNPKDASSTLTWKELQLPARALGVQFHSLEVQHPSDFGKAFEDATRVHAGALVITPSVVNAANLKTDRGPCGPGDRRRGRSGRHIPSRGILLSWATNHQNFILKGANHAAARGLLPRLYDSRGDGVVVRLAGAARRRPGDVSEPRSLGQAREPQITIVTVRGEIYE